jgi:hypothetical protein
MGEDGKKERNKARGKKRRSMFHKCDLYSIN